MQLLNWNEYPNPILLFNRKKWSVSASIPTSIRDCFGNGSGATSNRINATGRNDKSLDKRNMPKDQTVNYPAKVSIYIPAFNAEDTIKEALDSIIRQSYSNIEIIVIDDGSTDNTKNILSDYEKKNLIKLITHKKNMGIQDTYNEIYSIVESKFFCIYHADDTYCLLYTSPSPRD